SCASCGWRDQGDSIYPSRPGSTRPSMMAFHRQKRFMDVRVKPAHDGSERPACFLPPFARYRSREVGGGRATRQPGQVRKEAALTSTDRVARQPPTHSDDVAWIERSEIRGRSRGL